MTKPHLNRLTLRLPDGHGITAEILLNGEPLRGCHACRIEVVAGEMALVHLSLYADVEADLTLSPDQIHRTHISPEPPER